MSGSSLGATSEHTCDGSFSERTMALSEPYPGVEPPYLGNVTTTQEDLNAWVERVHRAGIQVNCHANGDVTIEMVLTAIERAQQLFPRPDARPKITHCTLINDDLVRRIKAVGAVPAPFTSYAYYNSDKFHFYGEALMQRAMAYRSFADAGIPAAAGSDFSPGPFAPLMGIQGMVTRTGWNGETWGANQRISVDEALRVVTINGAYASHEEGDQGLDHPGQARRLRRPRRTTLTPSTKARSRTSRSCAPSPAATRFTPRRPPPKWRLRCRPNSDRLRRSDPPSGEHRAASDLPAFRPCADPRVSRARGHARTTCELDQRSN